MPKPDDITTYKDLAKLNVPRLRELAAADTKLVTTAADKPELLAALCDAYGIEPPKQQKATEVQKMKAQVKGVRTQRDAQLALPPKERDKKQLDGARRQIKTLKRKMRKATKGLAR